MYETEEGKSYFGYELLNCGYKFRHDIFSEAGHKENEEDIRRTGDFKSVIIKFKVKNRRNFKLKYK